MTATLVDDVVQGAGKLLAGLGLSHDACLVSAGDSVGGIDVGDLEELQTVGGDAVSVRVIAIDTISKPKRAKVECMDTGEVLTVPIFETSEVPSWMCEKQDTGVADDLVDAKLTTIYQDYEDSFSLAANRADSMTFGPEAEMAEGQDSLDVVATAEGVILGGLGYIEPPVTTAWIVDGLRSEVAATMLDFKEKGPVGALRDASLDACDMLQEAIGVAVDGACRLRMNLSTERERKVIECAKMVAAGA